MNVVEHVEGAVSCFAAQLIDLIEYSPDWWHYILTYTQEPKA